MKNLICGFLAFALFSFVIAAHSTPLESADGPKEVSGAVGSYLPLIAQSRQDAWVLVKVVTDQLSGCATRSGFSTISGSYTVIQQLGASVAKRSGRYSWSQRSTIFRASTKILRFDPELSRWRDSELFSYRSDGKMPQSATRYLLCILNEGASGQDKFTDVHLVPEDWQDNVLPAVLYLRDHPYPSLLNFTDAAYVQTRSMVHSRNPFLVLTALQLLAANKKLTIEDMDVILSSTDVREVAAGIAISQIYSWTDLDTNSQWLKTRILGLRSIVQLEGVAVGILAANSFFSAVYTNPTTDLPELPDSTTPVEQQRGRREIYLTTAVRQKLNEIDPSGGSANAQWNEINSVCQLYGV